MTTGGSATHRVQRQVEWRDLLPLSRVQILREVLLPLPWLAVSLAAAAWGLYIVALPASAMFFLTGLRQVHGAFHGSIGLGRRGDDAVMFVLSGLMLGSMHAVRINHLRHHRHCLDEEDVEGQSARQSAFMAILTGPLFPIRMHRKALAVGHPRDRRWIVAELLLGAAAAGLAFGLGAPAWIRYHVVAMAAGQCLTAFFAVWTVHHGCEADGIFARTLRGALKTQATYHMFFHVEHHLFPAVPTCKLPVVAERLDRVAPELTSKHVF